MRLRFAVLSISSCVFLLTATASADSINSLSFVFNGGSYIYDTISNGTSPIGVTAIGGVANPFLNAGDSTVTLAPGSYLLVTAGGFATLFGTGTFSVRDGVGTLFSTPVTFPNAAVPGVNVLTLAISNGATLTMTTTGLMGDRTRVVSDAQGLSPDGINDTWYRLDYTVASVPEPGVWAMVASSVVLLVLRRKRCLAKARVRPL